jgi:hypothetical protein
MEKIDIWSVFSLRQQDILLFSVIRFGPMGENE